MGGLSIELLALLGILGAVLIFVITARFKAALFAYAGMLFASMIAAPIDWLGNPVQTWMTPLQLRRSEIFAACGTMLLAAALLHLPRIQTKNIAFQAVLVLCIGMYSGFIRIIASDSPMSGIETIAFTLLTILPAMLVVPALIRDEQDLLRFLRIIAFVSAVWFAACVVQFFTRRIVLTLGGGYTRFQGMLSNPQHAGAYLAVATWVCIFLVMNDPKLAWRPLWIGLSVVNGVMLAWTGSRTGLGMFSIGLVAIMYARIGAAILFLPIVGGIFAVALNFVIEQLGGDVNYNRGSGGGDTRTGAWVVLWEQFLESPLLGTGAREETKFSENSFLFGLATYGLVMGVILVTFLLYSGWLCLKLWRAKHWLDPLHRRFVDLFIGFNAMYFAGANFEGYLISRVSASLTFMLGFSALGPYLLQKARQAQHEAEWADPHAADAELLPEDTAGYANYGRESSEPPAQSPPERGPDSER